MTEAEWLACEDPGALLDFLGGRAAGRKVRLLGSCAPRSRWWPSLQDDRSWAALEVSERFADGLATAEELDAATRDASAAWNAAVEVFGPGDEWTRGAELALWAVHPGTAHNKAACVWADDDPTVCACVRDIFGNPFRPVVFSPEWRTDTAVALARQMYDAREFSAMPILADALQDAGCDNDDILNHARGPGPHVRGCWVVDLVLGRE
jgi:hypothetical protein